jgi:outer membrane protein assembly factor BamA
MKRSLLPALVLLLVIPVGTIAQKADTTGEIKTGFIPGGTPVAGYDSDIGFMYGVVFNPYFYGDGSRYPKYNHSIYLELSRTTKGSGKNIIRYDSDRVIKGLRTLGEISYLTEQALDFYGFNGYEAWYDRDYEKESNGNSLYKSRMFYRQDRKMLRLRGELTGDIIEDKLKWFGGIEYFDIKLDTCDIDKMNEGKELADQLKGVGGGLFGWYAYDWGILPRDQINGGKHTLIKAGLIYDTRDNEPNPMKGIWTEAQLIVVPSFLSDKDLTYTKLILTHRQYFTIIPRDLNLVYRLSYQKKLTGEIPFYMLPFVFNSPPNWTRDGLGGSNTMRGIMRNRVVGEDYLFGNLEARWKFVHFDLLWWRVYMALNAFLDGGLVTGKYDIDLAGVTDQEALTTFFPPDEKESLHLSTGGGLHIALNQNFIIAFDVGRALNERDGRMGYYVGLNFLF